MSLTLKFRRALFSFSLLFGTEQKKRSMAVLADEKSKQSRSSSRVSAAMGCVNAPQTETAQREDQPPGLDPTQLALQQRRNSEAKVGQRRGAIDHSEPARGCEFFMASVGRSRYVSCTVGCFCVVRTASLRTRGIMSNG